MKSFSIGMVGNIVTQSFSRLGNRLGDDYKPSIIHLDFGQVVQTLESEARFDFLVIHLDHRWFFDVAPGAESVERAEDLVERIRRWLDRGPGSVLLNTIPYRPRSTVDSDLHQQIEALHAIHRVFFDLAASTERVGIVDAAGILSEIGYATSFRERNRILMQSPYAPAAANAIMDGYAASIGAALRPRRKAIIVDADNTIWGGVVGEVGAESVAVDREYPGIVHFTLQQQLKRLRALGVILCAVTKNNKEDFLEVFAKRNMPLTLSDFTTYRSNWNPKSENIKEIANELNIGLDAIIFLDDNPFEIEEVSTRLPQVECHLFPNARPEVALTVLDHIGSLSARSLTAEDVVKAEQYRAEAERKQARGAAPTLEEYIASLGIQVQASVNDPSHLRRITQLTNKTNQFNLTCRRYVEAEIQQAMDQGHVYSFKVSDRFGDMGLVAVAIVRDGMIENLLMSCRALGRRVEIAILRYICDRHADVQGIYSPGPRNQMVAGFYDDNGFAFQKLCGDSRIYTLEQGPTDEQHFTIAD